MTSEVDLVTEGVRGVKENAGALSLQWGLRPATVSEYDPSTGVAFATYDGDTDPIMMISMVGVVGLGDQVFAIAIPPSGNYIVGFARGAPLGQAASIRFAADTQSVSAAAYIDVLRSAAPATFEFTKKRASTGVEYEFHAAAFATATNTDVQYALEIDGTDYPTAYMFLNPATQHQCCSAGDIISGIGAGTYEVTIRWLNNIGTTMNMNSNDLVSCVLQEVTV